MFGQYTDEFLEPTVFNSNVGLISTNLPHVAQSLLTRLLCDVVPRMVETQSGWAYPGPLARVCSTWHVLLGKS